jgi:hypothetical protein
MSRALVLDRVDLADDVVHGAKVGGQQPEHGVRACERLVDDLAVAVRSLHDLGTLVGSR